MSAAKRRRTKPAARSPPGSGGRQPAANALELLLQADLEAAAQRIAGTLTVRKTPQGGQQVSFQAEK